MPVTDTSRAAYGESKEDRLSQERRLFRLYRQHPEGLSDREVADHMRLTCALASARRNGLRKNLDGTDFGLRLVRKDKDGLTGKKVQFWTVARVDQSEQGALF